MKAILLGTGAGGGFPQWNSAAEACRRARAGDPAALPRTQCGLAVSADGARWVLVNASPDLRAQIEATPALHPRPEGGRKRHSPIAAVVLTGGEVDAIAGLLTLREGHRFALHAPASVLEVLAANPIFGAVNPALVPRLELPAEAPVALADADGVPLGLSVEGFAVPGKVPLFAETGGDPGLSEEATIGLRITDAAGHALVFVPGCAAVTEALRARLDGADCLCFDGTLWQDDEMPRAGIGPKTGRRMGHISIDGPEGTLAQLAGLQFGRRILVHLNNSNPALLSDSPEHAAIRAAGWEVGTDGMEIAL
ncbi:pyrroloquinoline quinone biosynthesis protein PqqB [Falsiroseomonas sp.]|uniref:pyrroloquinoline quinone biosynthesis protein PqqB n=1 Tax=Falsiroseomonas sp. TaxID=2870721 RepID=UPI003F730D37